MTGIDQEILTWIHTYLSSPFLDAVMVFFTYLGNWGLIWVVTGTVLLFNKRLRFYGICILVAVGLSAIIGNLVLKPLIDRPRPFVDDPTITLLINPPSTSSFPSGHAASSFAAATVLLFMPVAKPYKAAGLVVAILISFSRIYLEVHYPSDVLAGMVLGIVCGVAVVLLLRRTRLKKLLPDD